MTKPAEIVLPGEPGELAGERRGRGRPRGRQDSEPRAVRRYSPEKIIKAAGAAGFSHCSIDTDGKITVQMSRPADQGDQAASTDKGDNEWDTLLNKLTADGD